MKLTRAAYARLHHVSQQTIGRLVRDGVIHLEHGLLDVAAADAAIQESLDPSRSSLAAALAELDAEPVERQTLPDTPAADAENPKTLHDARAMKEKYAALAAKASFLRLRATLVEAAPVAVAAQALVAVVRDALLSIPARVAPAIAVEADPAQIDALLSAEIRKTCDGLADDLQRRAEAGRP